MPVACGHEKYVCENMGGRKGREGRKEREKKRKEGGRNSRKKKGRIKRTGLLKRKTFLRKNIQVMMKDGYLDGIHLPSDFTEVSGFQESSSPWCAISVGTHTTYCTDGNLQAHRWLPLR